LHVLMQTGARAFTYSVVSPFGSLIQRQTFDYGLSRPGLTATDDGRIFVAGGFRRLTENDIPPPGPEAARSQ
jgi:hypothetical protein